MRKVGVFRGEDGRILILGVGLAAFIIALILTVSTATSLYLQQMRLQRVCDYLATSASVPVTEGSPRDLPAQVHRLLARLPQGQKHGLKGIEAKAVFPSNSNIVTVDVRSMATITWLGPPVDKWWDGMEITAVCRARLAYW